MDHFTSLYRLYFYSNLNWYIVYRSTKSEINKIKIDQQTEQVLSNDIDDDESKVELERMDAIAQYLESGTYPGWYSKNQRRSIRKSLEKGQYEMKG